ncbi:TrmB family transcriptional regulator [Candidatus Woesearchaeota archaeon]|nr:TrmB family transcriptional regulator [Candidatus Woesearchaeota archaeon]
MIMNDEFLKKLRSAFDLNIYEVKIWTALLSKGVATAGELSDIGVVPRSRSYDILESLEKKGFVIMKLGKPIKYLAVDPNEIMKRVKKSLLDKANSHVKSLESVEKETFFNELNLLFKNGISHIDPTTISGSIRGRNNIYNHLESLIDNAQHNVTIITSEKGLKRKLDRFSDNFKKLSSKGVKVRIAAPLNKDSLKLIEKVKNNLELRNIGKMNARFVLIDGKELVFMISDDQDVHESYEVAIWIKSPFFVNAVDFLVGMSWAKLPRII